MLVNRNYYLLNCMFTKNEKGKEVKPWQNFHLRKRKMWIWQALHIGVFLRCQSNQVRLLCAVTLLKHRYSRRGKSLDNPKWGKFWLSQCTHAVKLCTLLLFLKTDIDKKKILFSTITRLGAPSLYRNMTYSVVYWTYSHPQLLCILCICTPERQTETKQRSENVFPPILKIGTWVYNVWPMQLVYFRIHQCIDQTSTRCYLGNRCDDIHWEFSDVALKDS